MKNQKKNHIKGLRDLDRQIQELERKRFNAESDFRAQWKAARGAGMSSVWKDLWRAALERFGLRER
jgi:hypothetical protein